MEEAYQLDLAVEVALAATDPSDTLIVVSADHSHTLTINGYPKRGNNILGVAGVAKDNLTYTTLMYGNGVGHYQGRRNVTEKDWMDKDFYNYAAVPFDEGPTATEARHGGEDVVVYARGPGAFLFTGVFDQIFVAHGIAAASCIGPHRDLCPDTTPRQGMSYGSVISGNWVMLALVMGGLIVFMRVHRAGYESLP